MPPPKSPASASRPGAGVGDSLFRRLIALMCLAFLVGLGVLCGCRGRTHQVEDTPVSSAKILGSSPIVPGEVTPDTLAAEKARIQAVGEARLAAVVANAKVAKAEEASDARTDFRSTVRTLTEWAMWGLVLCGLAAFVASWFPLGRSLGLDTGDARNALIGACVVALVRYTLLRWGMFAADVTSAIALVLLVVGGLAVGIPLGIGWFRQYILRQSNQLAYKGEPRPAAALRAAAEGITGQLSRARAQRRGILEEIEKGFPPSREEAQ